MVMLWTSKGTLSLLNVLCKFLSTSYNIARLKKSMFSILFIVALFYISYFPFLVFVGLHFSRQNHSQVALVFTFSYIFMFLSSSLNPLLYVWRIKDNRTGVKQLSAKLAKPMQNFIGIVKAPMN